MRLNDWRGRRLPDASTTVWRWRDRPGGPVHLPTDFPLQPRWEVKCFLTRQYAMDKLQQGDSAYASS